jgi:hypothetical protein
METAAASIIDDVRDFLASLKNDWPEIFAPLKRPKAEAPVPKAVSVAVALLPSQFVPPVAADAPLKSVLPEGNLVSFYRSRCEYWAPFLGVTFNRVSVKDQRTLWGSCTREGNLNFTWRLALAPDAVLDYVVVHELAHRAQMNHSRRFWEVVERVCPGHRTHRRWLRRNGQALHRAARPA